MFEIPATAKRSTRNTITTFFNLLKEEPLVGQYPRGGWYAIVPSSGKSKFNAQPTLAQIERRIRSEMTGSEDVEIYVAAFIYAWNSKQSA